MAVEEVNPNNIEETVMPFIVKTEFGDIDISKLAALKEDLSEDAKIVLANLIEIGIATAVRSLSSEETIKMFIHLCILTMRATESKKESALDKLLVERVKKADNN